LIPPRDILNVGSDGAIGHMPERKEGPLKRLMYVAIGMALGIGLMALYWRPAVEPVVAGGKPSGNGDVNASGAIDVADAIYLLSYLFASGPAPEAIVCNSGGGVPATGQDKCYDSVGSVIDCASADYPGQDGFYRAGCPKEGRYVDNGDGTVSDTCTGLVWQKDTADVNGNGADDPEDGLRWSQVLKYCDSIVFAGRDDWRLPNIGELLSIVDYGRSDPAIDPVFGGVGDLHWSSSPSSHSGEIGRAFVVYFRGGTSDSNWDTGGPARVRAVRSGL